MARVSHYEPGAWNVICDTCGLKIKSTVARKMWNGMYVCPEHWTRRHPLDFPIVVTPDRPIPYSRPGVFSTIQIKKADYTLLNADQTVYGDATTAALTLSLPAAPGLMEFHALQKIDASANWVTVSGNGKNIEVSPTFVLQSQYKALSVQYNGTSWKIVADK